MLRNLAKVLVERVGKKREPLLDVAQSLGISPDNLASIFPAIERALHSAAGMEREIARALQTQDLLDAAQVCRDVIADADTRMEKKLLAADRLIRLWDRFAKHEGTDQARTRVDMSMTHVSPVRAIAEAIAIGQRRFLAAAGEPAEDSST